MDTILYRTHLLQQQVWSNALQDTPSPTKGYGAKWLKLLPSSKQDMLLTKDCGTDSWWIVLLPPIIAANPQTLLPLPSLLAIF